MRPQTAGDWMVYHDMLLNDSRKSDDQSRHAFIDDKYEFPTRVSEIWKKGVTLSAEAFIESLSSMSIFSTIYESENQLTTLVKTVGDSLEHLEMTIPSEFTPGLVTHRF
eukprot:GHVP01056562.1.p1 GENE.GHVP01056562.1~~GHVP01056562.1.p1  ORF type:complete len:109 (+),score=14.05 GHVP01056562.1:379-705(+)